MDAIGSRQASRSSFNSTAHAVRGVASIAVFLAHILGGSAKHLYSDHIRFVRISKYFWNLGTFGVEIFFFISGYVIIESVKKYSLLEFLHRRFFRLYPIFLFFTIIYFSFNYMFLMEPQKASVYFLFSSLLFIDLFNGTDQLTPNAWSLSYEIWYYILCALIWSSISHRKTISIIAVSIACIVFAVKFPITIYFVFGIIAHETRFRIGNAIALSIRRSIEAAALLTTLVLAARSDYDYGIADFRNGYVELLIVCSCTFLTLAFQNESLCEKLIRHRYFTVAGTISYSLYLTHPYTYLGTRLLLKKMHVFDLPPIWGVSIFYLFVIPITLAITTVVHRTLEVTPYKWRFREKIFHLEKFVQSDTK